MQGGELAAAQAQKHVTHNDALLQLDALLFARFLSRNVSTPPPTPADGDTYLVKATANGAWTGQNGQIAYASGGVWRFTAPFTRIISRFDGRRFRPFVSTGPSCPLFCLWELLATAKETMRE